MCKSKMILDSVFFNYQDLEVLKGVYLEVEQGSITCLIGRNGSGKSTLFKIAAGQLHTDNGITRFRDKRLHRASKKERFEHLAYLPQKSFLPTSLKVNELINEGDFNKDDIIQRVKDSNIKNLSTGERRYVEILFVISLNRDFLLLDEPFTGLSPILIEKIIEHIKAVKKQGKGVLISDHYMRYIVDVGDTFYLLENGQVKAIDSE
ncbi:ATP-binding cassette domain-containing protein [Gracilimonas sp.]|uniref:ATP-binding cassette domain-containing protein n=1 Tax=Gracilimonas sp. TaxID=1974203 RepID=UPI002870F748|nr:ATP-binding cassette domain-containing protein [Gracilimonas sp.]